MELVMGTLGKPAEDEPTAKCQREKPGWRFEGRSWLNLGTDWQSPVEPEG